MDKERQCFCCTRQQSPSCNHSPEACAYTTFRPVLTGKCGSKTLLPDIPTPVFVTCTESNKCWGWKFGSNQDRFYGSWVHRCVPIPVCPLCVHCHVLVSLAMIEKHMLVGLHGGSVGGHKDRRNMGTQVEVKYACR